MRTIKFRAWDKRRKKMVEITYLGFDNSLSGGKATTAKIEKVWHALSRLELMQFTGLKDKKGKEIYEGDICQLYLTKYQGKFEVVWHNSKWLYREVGKKDNYFNFDMDAKIIGNIYENPELLKGGEK